MAFPIPEPANEFVAVFVSDGKFGFRIWPEQTEHLFLAGERRPMSVAAKLRPLLVLSSRGEIEANGAALVLPCSSWTPEEHGAQARAITANRVPHLHWLGASRAFREIGACTVDFRWTYRLRLALLRKATADARPGMPRGPVARLRDADLAELLRRFRAYLS